jgi:hypothetical protein
VPIVRHDGELSLVCPSEHTSTLKDPKAMRTEVVGVRIATLAACNRLTVNYIIRKTRRLVARF